MVNIKQTFANLLTIQSSALRLSAYLEVTEILPQKK